MGWDGFPKVVENGRVRTSEQVLLEELHPHAVAVKVNMKVGHAYAAVPGTDGHVHPWYYLADTSTDDAGTWIEFKWTPPEESPSRWPAAVASAITRWD